jgi:hypothetical protein
MGWNKLTPPDSIRHPQQLTIALVVDREPHPAFWTQPALGLCVEDYEPTVRALATVLNPAIEAAIRIARKESDLFALGNGVRVYGH